MRQERCFSDVICNLWLLMIFTSSAAQIQMYYQVAHLKSTKNYSGTMESMLWQNAGPSAYQSHESMLTKFCLHMFVIFYVTLRFCWMFLIDTCTSASLTSNYKLTVDVRSFTPNHHRGTQFRITYSRSTWPSVTSSTHWRHYCSSWWHDIGDSLVYLR